MKQPPKNSGQPSESDLWRVGGLDKRALEDLTKRLRGMLKKIGYTEDEANDAVQDAWESLNKAAGRGEVISIEALLPVLARHRAVDGLRAAMRSRGTTPRSKGSGSPSQPVQDEGEPKEITGSLSYSAEADAGELSASDWQPRVASVEASSLDEPSPCVAQMVDALMASSVSGGGDASRDAAFLRLVTGIGPEMFSGERRPPRLVTGGVPLLIRLVFGRRLLQQAIELRDKVKDRRLWQKLAAAVTSERTRFTDASSPAADANTTSVQGKMIAELYREHFDAVRRVGIVSSADNLEAVAEQRYICATVNVLERLHGDKEARKTRLLHKQVRFFYGPARYLAWKRNPASEIDMEHAVRQRRAQFSARIRALCERFCEPGMCGSIGGAIEAL